MIKSIYIDNFKALNEFAVPLNPLTVLIGANGCGKSTILQAIDLVCSLVNMDIRNYMDERKWVMEDLKSHFSTKPDITFRTLLELPVNGKTETIQWELVLRPFIEKIELVSETIFSISRGKLLLKMDANGFERYNEKTDQRQQFPSLTLSMSLLSTIDIDKDGEMFPSLTALKTFALGIDSFELLTTEKIRNGYRGKADSIGTGGEKLASFIHTLEGDKKERLINRIKKYVPFINGIETGVNRDSGRIEMAIMESFNGKGALARVKALHSSDGILRLIAISALAEINKTTGIILMDEIEDSINPYLSAGLVTDLLEITQHQERQVLVTTHNSVVLDYFPPESVVFLWRNQDGTIQCKSLFENEELRSSLEYMHPGEVWINMSEADIIEKLHGKV